MTALDLPWLDGPLVERLHSVDGYVVFDVPEATTSGGGTRLVADVDVAELRLLARSMSYKVATLGLRFGGAKVGLRAAPAARTDVLRRFREEIAPLLVSGRLMTGPDLGTEEADFVGLPTPGGGGMAISSIDGMPGEQALTGIGVAAAAATATGGLDGRRFAIEGFGKMGASIARAVVARGAVVRAVSTRLGSATARDEDGFDLARLLEAQREHGDELVMHLGVAAQPPAALWSAPCDVVVPGARPGSVDAATARCIRAAYVVPVANAPYTAEGLRVLAARGISAHADFVCSAGGAMAYVLPEVAHASEAAAASLALERTMSGLVAADMEGADSPYAHAVERAQRFVASWRSPGAARLVPPLCREP